jgi:hypothetical protein
VTSHFFRSDGCSVAFVTTVNLKHNFWSADTMFMNCMIRPNKPAPSRAYTDWEHSEYCCHDDEECQANDGHLHEKTLNIPITSTSRIRKLPRNASIQSFNTNLNNTRPHHHPRNFLGDASNHDRLRKPPSFDLVVVCDDDERSTISDISVNWETMDELDPFLLVTDASCDSFEDYAEEPATMNQANEWVVEVIDMKCPWFKMLKKNSDGILMLEGDEVLEVIESLTAKCLEENELALGIETRYEGLTVSMNADQALKFFRALLLSMEQTNEVAIDVESSGYLRDRASSVNIVPWSRVY